ncbi:hypothetical protein V6C27_11140 [Peptococcaceae bacterium 1198_IL3148]
MKCEICKKAVNRNYGNAYHVLCKECSNNDTAEQIEYKVTKATAKNKIDIYPKPITKQSVIGFLILISIYGLIMMFAYQLSKYYGEHLFLPIVAIIVLAFILLSTTKNIYSKKLIHNCIIAQAVRKKLNKELITSIIIIVVSITLILLIANKTSDYYNYLLKEMHIHSLWQLFNLEFMRDMEAYAYKSNDVMLYYTILEVQDGLASLLSMCAFFVMGMALLYSALQSEAISKIGILTAGTILKWENITSYGWSEYYEDQTINKSTGYYDLELTHRNGKLLSYVLGEKESHKRFKISATDMDKVDKLLSDEIKN